MSTQKVENAYRQMRLRIEQMKEGERFPSVRYWISELGLSQLVVNKAMTRLKDEGLVRATVGEGTFVCKNGDNVLKRVKFYAPDWPSYSNDLEIFLRELAQSNNCCFTKVLFSPEDRDFSFINYSDTDAILMIPSCTMLPSTIELMMQAPIPVVFLRASLGGTLLNHISGDNFMAGRLAAEHLINLGHRRILYLQSEPESITSLQTNEAFCELARARDTEVIYHRIDINYGELSTLAAYNGMNKLLTEQGLEASAIFVASEYSTLGVYKALSEHNIRIPQDISVISFGGDHEATLYTPALSSVIVSRQKMAQKAFQMLHDCWNSGNLLGHHGTIFPELARRDSTCALTAVQTPAAT